MENNRSVFRTFENGFIYFFKFDLAVNLVLVSYLMVFVPIWLVNVIGSDETLWVLGIWGGFTGLTLLAWRNAKNRAGILFAGIPLAYSWWLTDEIFVNSHIIVYFANVGTLGWLAIILTTLVLVFGFLILLIKSILKFHYRDGIPRTVRKIRTAAQDQRGLLVFSLTLIMICSLYVGITGQSYARGEIAIIPPKYQVHFAFWALTDPTTYNSAELNEMNDHQVTLIGGAPGVGTLATDLTNASVNVFVSNMTWWLNKYPNVTFSITVPGIPLGGGYWDGCASGTTQECKALIQVVQQYHLTNVIGETYDWESSPNATNPETPNATLHQQAIQIWNDFFDWKDRNAPNFTCTVLDDVYLYYAKLAGDSQLAVYRQEVSFDVPRFDEYAPSIYRCFYGGPQPYGSPTSVSAAYGPQDTYDLYESMEENAQSMTGTFGNVSRMGVYLGETNCSCYGNNTSVYENGIYQGTGWDVLVRDTLICKSFGPKTITFFLLFNAYTGPDNKGWVMGGMFASYGDDFLDRLDAAVNGVNSTNSFTIQKGPISLDKTGLPGDFYFLFLECVYNLNKFLPEFATTVIIIVGIRVGTLWSVKRNHRKADKQNKKNFT